MYDLIISRRNQRCFRKQISEIKIFQIAVSLIERSYVLVPSNLPLFSRAHTYARINAVLFLLFQQEST